MAAETAETAAAVAIPRYARIDVIGGAIMVFLAVQTWIAAIGLDIGEISNFGPGMMPRGLAIALFVAGSAVLINGLIQSGSAAEKLRVAWRPPSYLALAIGLFALFIRGGDFWILATPQLGLCIVGPLTVVVAGFATPQADARELAVLAFGLTAAALLVFSDLLGVLLPVFPGVLERAIPPAFGHDAAVRVAYLAYGAVTAALFYAFFLKARMRHD